MSVVKGSKLKIIKFGSLISTFAEVAGGKLVGELFKHTDSVYVQFYWKEPSIDNFFPGFSRIDQLTFEHLLFTKSQTYLNKPAARSLRFA